MIAAALFLIVLATVLFAAAAFLDLGGPRGGDR